MISKKEFDLLLKEISQIENKIVEIKILNQYDKATEYEENLNKIKEKARDIQLSENDKSEGFDEISLEVLSELILLDTEVDYYILKTNNIIESAIENKIDAAALEKIKGLWTTLEEYIKFWNESIHNPIEEVEYNKQVGKITLEIIIYQLQTEGIINYSKVFKYCKKDALVNAVKELLFEGAKDEQDEIRRRKIINLAKNASEKDLYDYKLWQQILMIKDVRSRDDHIEIIVSIQEKENSNYFIEENYKPKVEVRPTSTEEQEMDLYYEESFFKSLKNWFSKVRENAIQKRMEATWLTDKGPGIKVEFNDEDVKYASEYLDKNIIENTKKLIIASNGIAKYNFEKGANWENLEEIEFIEEPKSSGVNLSPDKSYNCIGNEAFANCPNLKHVDFGRIGLIGERAFENCKKLTNIIFPKSLINIGEDAFLGCTNITKVVFLSDPKLYIMDRPQNVINCFRGTNLEEIVFSDIQSAFNFAIADCPKLQKIQVANVPGISIPFKTCKYRIGRQEGIVSFVGEKSLQLWKKKNTTIRYFELTEEDRKKYNI
ncbi:MAG: leucine-rich repeat domain-containing protein [Clostridia bacterium]|nr:leucine-rich repeat domain-containing protein [Clostridia bacterium]